MKDAKEGIVVAGGHGYVSTLKHVSYPEGVIVDHLENVYVADSGNHRIMRWLKGSREGSVLVGGNVYGQQPDQLNSPAGLAFDRESNLYIADRWNHRIQKFRID
jgi:sugar lactone lactonase YvrE